MPFLPDSIRGEDYDPDKDESLNLMAGREINIEPPAKYQQLQMNLEIDEEQPTDQSMAEVPASHMDLVAPTAFIGTVSLENIMEGIENQFTDYIKLEDDTNYVDVFYDQLHASYEAAKGENDVFQEDTIEALDTIQQTFIDKMSQLFETRLTLTIADIDGESVDLNDIEFIIRRLYEFFILDAKNNFKVAISHDARKRMVTPPSDHRAYMKQIRELMLDYSPLITTFGSMEFLQYRGDQEIIELFETGKVVGNFLRKYSPKLYQNEEFEVDLINYITMVQQLKQEVYDNGGQQ